MKTRIIELLKTVNREGMDKLIEALENGPFFTDPASAMYHGNYEGGLAEHSLAVYEELVKLTGRDDDTVKIVGLLHDICKIGTYTVEYKNAKNENGQWERVPYYKAVGDDFPYGHGEKSVLLISKYIKLTIEEIMAIRWHMGPYESDKIWRDLEKAQTKWPLVMYAHFADVIATRLRA